MNTDTFFCNKYRHEMEKFFTRFCILILIFSTFHASSAKNKLSAPSIEDYGQLPSIDNMVISPSGQRIAYRKTTDSSDLIIVYSLAENKRITGVKLEDNSRPEKLYFVNENELILVIRNFERMDGYVNEVNLRTAYVFNIKKNQLRLLLKKEGKVYGAQASLGTIIGLSPNKKRIYMSAFSGNRLSMYDKDRPKYSLFNVRIAAPRKPKYHAHGSTDTIDYFVNENGEVLVEERYNNRNNEHIILVKVAGDWKTIYQKTVLVRDINVVGVSPDFKNLVILDEDNQTGRISYFNMSLDDGTLTSSSFNRNDADIEQVITDINRVVYGVRYSGFNPSYKFFDTALNTRIKNILQQFPDNSIWLQSWSPDWKHLVIYAEGPNTLGDFFYFPLDEAPSFILSARPNFTPEEIHPIAEMTIIARDGLKIPTLLTIPQQHLSNMKNMPAVILPHGGPESYDHIGFDWLAQAIANQGFLVIQPQFRGSIGFGVEHRLAGYGQWGKKMQNDLSDSLMSLVKKKIVDPEKVCIVGSSYGGYAALAGGAFTPDLYQCVISVNGVSDINKMLSSTEYNYGNKHWVLSYWKKLVSNGKADKNSLAAISPGNFGHHFTAATLLIHSENDNVVLIKQSKNMQSELKRHKKSVKFVELKDEDHYLSTTKGRLRALQEILSFLDKHIG